MSAFLQNHMGLAIIGAICAVATLVLTAIGLSMRGAGLSLRPVLFIGGFFAIIALPQLAAQLAMAKWPKPKAALDETAIAGEHAFARPERIFGPTADALSVQDARQVFVEALGTAEVAQLVIRESGETAVAARFVNEEAAKAGAATLWTMFDPQGTSGDEITTWGTRNALGDKIALQRIGRGVFMWTGADRAAIEARMRHARLLSIPVDTRPRWLAAFESWQVAVPAVALFMVAAAAWFFQGAAWAGRTDPDPGSVAVSAAELERRIAALAAQLPVQRLADGRWELIAPYETTGEVGAYRYVLRLDESAHVVNVVEYSSSRQSPSGNYNWKMQRGITFYRKGPGVDLQQSTGPLQRTVTEAGWIWQPVLFDAPRGLRWLTG